MSTATAYTAQQLSNWRKYEQVRASGKENMLSPRARSLTGLSEDDYWFCLDNYEVLAAAQPTGAKP